MLRFRPTADRQPGESAVPAGSARILILQSSDKSYAPLLQATAATNRRYARAHGYGYRQWIGNFSRVGHTGNFNRYYLLRQAIRRGRYDWALWLDADAIVIDHGRGLAAIIDRTPGRLLIACRGAFGGEHDVNNGVFLLNLRHPLAGDLLQTLIARCEALDPQNASFQDDQHILHDWLLAHRDVRGRIEVCRCYTGPEYNLFNYDGPFIRHVLRDFGTFEDRRRELLRLAAAVPGGAGTSPEGRDGCSRRSLLSRLAAWVRARGGADVAAK